MRQKDCTKTWKAARLEACCPRMLRHDSLRTAVRDMVNAGVTERVAMKVIGHKTHSVLDRYHILSPTVLQEVAWRLTGTFSGTFKASQLETV